MKIHRNFLTAELIMQVSLPGFTEPTKLLFITQLEEVKYIFFKNVFLT